MKLVRNDDIDIIIQNNKKTPRVALCLYFSIEKPEKYSGAYSLFTKLLFQGTKNRTAQELADELENNAIETTAKCKQDYLRISSCFLNEDFDLALDILADIIENSTFDDFEKEVHKTKGEIAADLDLPKTRVADVFVSEIFKGHYYQNNNAKTLEEIDKIKKSDMGEILEQLRNSRKVISIAGDFENEEEIIEKLSKKLTCMRETNNIHSEIPQVKELTEDITAKITKNDANQAQVVQGWLVESIHSKDYAKIIVMNNILGSSGLSSRLFCELRDKQGLAYTVRSSYETLTHGAVLSLYIATSPKNIKKSLDGFRREIEKLQTTLVTDAELQGGKENVLGRLEYFYQTNMQKASTKGWDFILDLGLDYETKYKDAINAVTAEDVRDMAKKYFCKNSVTAILAPKEYLDF